MASAWGRTSTLRPLRRHMSSDEGSLVRFAAEGNVAEITLCRPKKLNSLSLPMIHELRESYTNLVASGAKAVILRGEGRALCAGGDVAEVREGVLEGNRYPADFFYEEYTLDYDIATLHEKKGVLQVALWDGIVMGGGVGLSVHSPVRIATEKTLFAMPETAIGLFPDVGATYALSRLKAGAHIGVFLGLTGNRVGAADALFAGLATHYVPSERLPGLKDALQGLGDASDLNAVSAAIDGISDGATPDTAKAALEQNAAAIERCFGNADSVEEIIKRLEAEGSEWSTKTLSALRARSPTSVKVSHEAIRRHASISLRETFMAEYRLACWCMRPQPESDFCEGIRAVLVDKDNKPVWVPATIEEVSAEKVEGFFAPLAADHPRGELPL